jgi:hypothetical protein
MRRGARIGPGRVGATRDRVAGALVPLRASGAVWRPPERCGLVTVRAVRFGGLGKTGPWGRSARAVRFASPRNASNQAPTIPWSDVAARSRAKRLAWTGVGLFVGLISNGLFGQTSLSDVAARGRAKRISSARALLAIRFARLLPAQREGGRERERCRRAKPCEAAGGQG